jgi:hypothetical protein
MSDSESLLRAILSLAARQAFSVEALTEVVTKGGGRKQLEAFNLCDGTKTQAEVVKVAKLDQGNFSKTVARWINSGVMFRLGEGRETRLLHAYPLPTSTSKKGKRSDR